MFELNPNLKVKKECVQNYPIYLVDNFYKNPDEVSDYLFNRDVPLWKIGEQPSFNSKHFFDHRLIDHDDRIYPAYKFITEIFDSTYQLDNVVITNMTRFLDNPFNNYKEKYWWPHIDSDKRGQMLNAIVYLNKNEENSGTNLYDPEVMNNPGWKSRQKYPEHFFCWATKSNFKIIKTFKSIYNRLVIFDGSIPHGMNITNDRFFGNEYRCNQVFFLNKYQRGTQYENVPT